MAFEPNKRERKKKQESAQTKVKRTQAAKRRIRNKGQFAPGPSAHHHAAFHSTVFITRHKIYKGDNPQGQLFDVHEHEKQERAKSRARANAEAVMKDSLDPKLQERVAKNKEKQAERASRPKVRDADGNLPADPGPERRKDPGTTRDARKSGTQRADQARQADETMRGNNDHFRQQTIREQRRVHVAGEAERLTEAQEDAFRGHFRERANSAKGWMYVADNVDDESAGTHVGGKGRKSGAINMGDDETDVPFAEGKYDGEFIPRVDQKDFSVESKDYGAYQEHVYNSVKHSLLHENPHMTEKRAHQTATQIAYEATRQAHNGVAVKQEVWHREMQPRIRKEDLDNPIERMRALDERQIWRDHRGTLAGSPAPDADRPIRLDRTKKHAAPQDTKDRLPNTEIQFLASQMEDHASVLYGANAGSHQARQNMEDYLALREDGWSSDEIMDWFKAGKPDHLGALMGQREASMRGEFNSRARNDMMERQFGNTQGLKDKYDTKAPDHKNFAYSMQAAGVDSLEELRKRNPNASVESLVRYQQAQRETIDEYMLANNERWAHERRAARVKGKGDGANIEDDDRVVFFTTNLGAPNASVPANSLVGQYIIKKRKKMVVDEKQASRAQVKGEFPKAVRDQHLIEVSTGVRLGMQSRVGVYHNTGWKMGNKRSKGYGKNAAVGSHALRDSTGQPIYDKDGNIRYTEGYTRAIDAGTNRDVGLRIFVG